MSTGLLAWLMRSRRRRRMAKIARLARSQPPEYVQIENTNHCNGRCVFCPHDRMKRSKGFMDFGLFERIVRQCVEAGVRRIGVHNFGEPLLDKAIVRRIGRAKELGIPEVMMYTNAVLLEGELAEEVLHSGLDELYVSVDGYDEEDYSKLRLGLDRARVEANLRAFMEAKRAAGTGPKVIVKANVHAPVDKERARRAVDRAADLADAVDFGEFMNWPSDHDLLFQKNPVPRYPCWMIFRSMIILHDGRVALCCLDYEGEVILGDLTRQGLMEIWRGERLADIRHKHLACRFQEVFYCSRCSYTADHIPWTWDSLWQRKEARK